MADTKPRVMYMHTLDGRPASFDDTRGPYVCFASNGHRVRAARLVPTLRQLRQEQQAAIREELKHWSEMSPEYRPERPSSRVYGYVLVEVPS